MRVNTEYAKYLSKICSTDKTRPSINHVNLNVQKARLEATNGHMGVIVPVVIDDLNQAPEGDTSGPITKEALAESAKHLGFILANGNLQVPGGPSFPRPDVGDYPDIDSVIPKYASGDEGTVTLSFNANYLLALAKIVGDRQQVVTLTIPVKGAYQDGRAIVVKGVTSDALGILMPCNIR